MQAKIHSDKNNSILPCHSRVTRCPDIFRIELHRCFCTERRLELLKKEAARNRTNNKYDGRCAQLTSAEVEEKLSNGLPFTIRFKIKGGVEKNTLINDKTSKSSMFDDLVFGKVNQSGALDNEGDPIIVKVNKNDRIYSIYLSGYGFRVISY